MGRFLRPFLLALLILAAPAIPASFAEPVAASVHDAAAQQEVQDALADWLDAVNEHDLKTVLGLYDKDAVLLPAMSAKLCNTPELRRAYYEKFFAHPNLDGDIDRARIRVMGDLAVASGFYTFTYSENGETVEVPARFSFVYKKTPDGWLIVDHHSSKTPEAD